MRKPLIGAILGLVVGALFGSLLALVIHLNQPADPSSVYWIQDGSTSTIRLYLDPSYSAPQEDREAIARQRALLQDLFLGILLGGGFGAVVGVLAGATATTVQVLRETRDQEWPPVRKQPTES